MSTSFTINSAQWETDKEQLQAVRYSVFVEEQAVPIEEEWDDHDEDANHWLALSDTGEAVGTVRMLSDGHIGRMAVLKSHRKLGIGQALLKIALTHARELNLYEAYLYAQTHAVEFYRNEGFAVFGEEFMDANIPHLTMRLKLAEHRLLGVHGGNFPIDALKQTIIELVQQTSKQLRILSYDLDPDTFDNEEMAQCISAFARKSGFSDIRILVANTTAIVKRGHRLLTLQRRLPSIIQIRKTSDEAHLIQDNMIIADQYAIISQSIEEPAKIWSNFNNKPAATNYAAQFDDLWERGHEDADLRQLGL